MARHKQNEIGHLSTSRSSMSRSEKIDLLHALKTGPWRGPDEIIRKLEKEVGARSHVVREGAVQVTRIPALWERANQV